MKDEELKAAAKAHHDADEAAGRLPPLSPKVLAELSRIVAEGNPFQNIRRRFALSPEPVEGNIGPMTTTTTTTTKPRRTRKAATTPTTVEEWAEVLAKAENGSDAQAEAMKGMRGAGASYAQMAAAMGVVPMTARSRYLKVS
jgi:hypothetical protein